MQKRRIVQARDMRRRAPPAPSDRDQINALIDAWEALPGGRNYGPEEVARWLRYRMAPAINSARKHIGRRRPDESAALVD